MVHHLGIGLSQLRDQWLEAIRALQSVLRILLSQSIQGLQAIKSLTNLRDC